MRAKVATTLIGVGMLGFGLGVVVGRRITRAQPQQPSWIESGRTGPDAMLQTLPGASLFDQLDLSAEQRARVDSILADARPRLDAAMNPLLDDIRTVVENAHIAVREVLDPDQEEQLDSLLASLPVFRLRSPPP